MTEEFEGPATDEDAAPDAPEAAVDADALEIEETSAAELAEPDEAEAREPTEEGDEPSAEPNAGDDNEDTEPDVGHIRMAEALLFASADPLDAEDLASKLPEGVSIAPILAALETRYAERGVVLVEIAGRWAFRTAPDLAYLLEEHAEEEKRLSRAALETLAIVAYHQPVTRAEIEEIRGVSVSKGTLDQLLEIGWVRMRGRRRTPGRPVTYGTTDEFLEQFSLAAVGDLPGLDDLKAAGLLDSALPPGFVVPDPGAALANAKADEDALDGEEGAEDLGYRPEAVSDGDAAEAVSVEEAEPDGDLVELEEEEMEAEEPPRLAAGE